MQVEKFKLQDLVPNAYNPNIMPEDKLVQLKKIIKTQGYWQFIVVRKHPTQENKYEIIDGEHRWQAMKDEPEFQDPQYVVVVESDDDLSKIQTINFNSLRGEMDSVKVASIIHDLLQNTTMEELEKNLGMTQEEIKNYDEMATFDFEKFNIEADDVPDISELEQTFPISIELNATEFALYNDIKVNAITNLSEDDKTDDKKVFLEFLNRLKLVEEDKPEGDVDISEKEVA